MPQAPQPKQPPDAVGINRLIEQLGSAKFAEREAAAKALEAIGPPAVEPLRTAAVHHKDPEVRRRALQLLQGIENSLEQLVIDYQAYGLPLPPKKAKLVRVKWGGNVTVNGERIPPTFPLAFMLKARTWHRPPTVLVGWHQYDIWNVREAVEPERATAKDIQLWVRDSCDALLLAIQCKARGWDPLAQVLLEKSRKEDSSQPPRTALADLAWRYWAFKLSFERDAADWPMIARYMNVLIAAERTLDTNENRFLLKALDDTLVPSKAKPGSVPAMIDELLRVRHVEFDENQPDQRCLQLVEMGFAAIPDLIEHLEDMRVNPGLGQRVCDLVSDLLVAFAGQPLGREELEDHGRTPAKRRDAKEWWEKVSKVGEEHFLLSRVLPTAPGADRPNYMMLRIIAKKHPYQLPELYRTVLEKRPKIESYGLAEAIIRSSLPRSKKRELLLYGVRHEQKNHSRPALLQLRHVDSCRFDELLIELLERSRATPDGPYSSCSEGCNVYLVLETANPQVWEALKRTAKRADVGLRMEMLSSLRFDWGRNGRLQQRLELLAAFLDDVEIRDASSSPKYDTWHAASKFPKLEVRNMAALSLAWLLDLPGEPKPDWTDDQWAKFRAEVRQALKREAGKTKARGGQ